MNDKHYPQEQLDKDLQTIREMDIPVEDKSLKGRALMYLYYEQNDKKTITKARKKILEGSIREEKKG